MTEHELDPELRRILDRAPQLSSLDFEAMRQHAIRSKAPWNDLSRPWLDLNEDAELTAATSRPVFRYRADSPYLPPLIWLHGGGWSICSPRTHHAIFAELARITNRDVIALHPRQAPEHPYPAALQDVASLLLALREPFHLGGDSAGANLALGGLTYTTSIGHRLQVHSLTLAYGCYRAIFDTDSHTTFGGGEFGLSTQKMQRFWDAYEGSNQPMADFRDLQGLPPVPLQLHVSPLDPLRDDSLWLADQARASGIDVDTRHWPGMTHGFLHHAPELPQAMAALGAISDHLERNDT